MNKVFDTRFVEVQSNLMSIWELIWIYLDHFVQKLGWINLSFIV